MKTKKLLEKKLKEVIDPELGINIVDLGLIYDFSLENRVAKILMTLTFPGCPLGFTIKEDINRVLSTVAEIEKVELTLTFNPPWDLSMINPLTRAELGR